MSSPILGTCCASEQHLVVFARPGGVLQTSTPLADVTAVISAALAAGRSWLVTAREWGQSLCT